MKKRLWFYTTFFICVVLLYAGGRFYVAHQEKEEWENLWKTNRSLPEDLDVHAYLSGNFARQTGKADVALKAYLNALEKDPNNQSLRQEIYLLAMIQGQAPLFLPYLDKFTHQAKAEMMADYVQVAHLIQQGKTQQAVKVLTYKKTHPIDKLLVPLIKSWIYAKEGQRPQAFQILNELDEKKFAFAKGYQTFLLGAYFNDSSAIEKGIQQMQGKRLPAVGFFPLMKKYVAPNADLFQQYEKMVKNYPVTADLIQFMGQQNLTFDTGLAEIFYFVSADEGNNLLDKKEALFLNSVALLLDPHKTLALIWGAELTQALNLPQVSLLYYAHLPQKNATLLFKQAHLMTLVNQSDKAMEILTSLKTTNQDNVPLLTLMAQIYTEKHQEHEALKLYDLILNQYAKKLDNKNLAKTHLMRANINYNLGRTDDLILDLEKAYILMPDDAMIQNDLGYNKLLQGQTDEGFELVQQAYQKNPKSPYILDSLAFAYSQKNQFLVALPFAERALELMPQSALINMHLGDIYQALGRKREAQFQYKKALDLKTDLTPEMEKTLAQKSQFKRN